MEAEQQRRKVIEREAGKAGFRGRVNAKCAECIYDPCSAGNWRKQVQECIDKTCPLWEVRPVSTGEDNGN